MSSDNATATATAAEAKTTQKGKGLSHRFIFGMIRRNPIKSVAFVGAVAAAVISKQKKDKKVKALDAKKKVLVLPFYKMKIVEETPKDFRAVVLAKSNSSSGGSTTDKTMEIAVDELVTVIHKAAEDPNVVALYGIFGQGHGFQTGGWAHIQEIRNALLVFQQSHRCHKEPNLQPLLQLQEGGGEPSEGDATITTTTKTAAILKTPTHRKKKVLYAYANSFASPMPGADGMKEYYLASVFTHIHLQSHGDLNLFGLHSTNTFLKDCFKNYGVTVDVFKHGAYKNFANRFTHASFTKEHRENVEGILKDIQEQVCNGIYTARNATLKSFEVVNFWKMVHQAGSFPAEVAHKIGFVDYMPRKDPLQVLLEVDNNKKTKKGTLKRSKTKVEKGVYGDSSSTNTNNKNDEIVQSWGAETDLDQFGADTKISVTEYARLLKQKEAKESKQWAIYKKIRDAVKKYDGMDKALAATGFAAPYYNIPESEFSENRAKGLDEKIAVIKIGGAITEATARKAEKALRKLKHNKEVKAVVLRVDSPGGAVSACETIYQEIQDLAPDKKVVVSFGNVSASGGYYISANADRIFASPMSITGSIGVFMIRLDFRALAKQYGITFDSVATSDMSGSFDPFYPANRRMKDNFANFAERTYMHFKTLVGKGRGMDMDMVETVAQGRVWTGDQAKRIGLVDELGGLERAIAYCQRNYTSSGQAEVVSWPPKKSVFDLLNDQEDSDLDEVEIPGVFHYLMMGGGPLLQEVASKFLPVSDDSAVSINGSSNSKRIIPRISAASGMMLTVDENWAIRCLLQESGYTDILSEIPEGYLD